MRSSTPPWPGNSRPLSFRSVGRLNMLSVRSPTTENAAAARHSGRKRSSGTANQWPAGHGDHRREQHAAEHAFPGLARRDVRRELHAAKEAAGEIGAGIGREGERQDEQRPLRAARPDLEHAHQRDPGRHQREQRLRPRLPTVRALRPQQRATRAPRATTPTLTSINSGKRRRIGQPDARRHREQRDQQHEAQAHRMRRGAEERGPFPCAAAMNNPNSARDSHARPEQQHARAEAAASANAVMMRVRIRRPADSP